MRHQLATLGLAPLLLIQGLHTRRVTPQLPEPPGARDGCRGNGSRLRLLITGDSAAAGVGASHQDEALAGHLVKCLSRRFTVDWELHAKTGATTQSTIEYLTRLSPRTFNIVVTSLGVNDVTSGISHRRWVNAQLALRDLLRSKFNANRLLIAGLPPVHLFPALPQPLRWYLGRRATDFSSTLQRELTAERDSEFLDLGFGMDESTMASDGFHPGTAIYAEWARRIASLV